MNKALSKKKKKTSDGVGVRKRHVVRKSLIPSPTRVPRALNTQHHVLDWKPSPTSFPAGTESLKTQPSRILGPPKPSPLSAQAFSAGLPGIQGFEPTNRSSTIPRVCQCASRISFLSLIDSPHPKHRLSLTRVPKVLLWSPS